MELLHEVNNAVRENFNFSSSLEGLVYVQVVYVRDSEFLKDVDNIDALKKRGGSLFLCLDGLQPS